VLTFVCWLVWLGGALRFFGVQVGVHTIVSTSLEVKVSKIPIS